MSETIGQNAGGETPSAEPRGSAIAIMALGVARYLAAWAAAVVVATLMIFAVAMGLDAVSAARHGEPVNLEEFASNVPWLLAAGVIVAAMTAPVWPILVFFARLLKAHRGSTDALFGALMGAADVAVFSGGTLQPGMIALFAVAGGAAGFVFWLVAGRPRPPYRSLWLPG